MIQRERKNAITEEVIKLGIRISEIIKEKNLKTREVAHDADMDVENLRKYIKGKQEMRVTTLLKVTKALNVDIEELFKPSKAKKKK